MGSQSGEGNPPGAGGDSADNTGNLNAIDVVEVQQPPAAPPARARSVPPPPPPGPTVRRPSVAPPPPPPGPTGAATASGNRPNATLPHGSLSPARSGTPVPPTGAGTSTPRAPAAPVQNTLQGVSPPPAAPAGSTSVNSAPPPAPPPPGPQRSTQTSSPGFRPGPPAGAAAGTRSAGAANTMQGYRSPAAASPPASPAAPAASAVQSTPPVPSAPSAPDVPPEELPWTVAHDRIYREAEALSTSQPVRAALLLAALARTSIDARNDPATATAALSRASALASDSRFVPMTRRWIAERRGKPEDVLALARAELPLAGDPRERLSLLWQIAAIEEFAAGRADAAERALREIAALDPNDLSVWESLSALHLRRKQYKETVDAWEKMAGSAEDPAFKAGVYTAAASVREALLDDTAGAQPLYRRALELDPTNVAAQSALEPIYFRSKAWTDYARTVVTQGDHVGDAAASRECYERAGDVLWECASDGASAAACYERAAQMAPREVLPLEKFAAVLEGTGRFEALPRVYERMLQVLRDPTQQAAVLYRLGSIYETRLKQSDEAVRAYRRSLEIAPTFAASTNALSALYRRLDRWTDLSLLELADADRLEDPRARAQRYVAVAITYETVLVQHEDALSLYERAYGLDPSNTAAFDSLDRIYRVAERWDDLIVLHESLLKNVRDPRRVRATSLQLAALHHDRGGNPERAALLLKTALSGDVDNFPTLLSLARALSDAGKWPEYVDVLEQQARLIKDENELVATLFRIGLVIETRLNDARRALGAYQRVLERAPRHEGALRALVRVHQTQQRWDDVISTERKLLDLGPRPEEAAATLYRLGRLAEERLGRPDDAVGFYDEALTRLPTYTPALVALDRLLRKTAKFARLAEVLEKQIKTARDDEQRVRLMLNIASLYELHLNDPARATATFERALELSPGLDAALWGLARIREVRGEWKPLETVLLALLGRNEHPGARTRLLVRLARLNELRTKDPGRAAQLYEEALATAQEGTAALALDRLRVAQADGDRETMARWLDHVAHGTTEARQTLALLRLRALQAEYGGGSTAESVEAYSRALVCAPTDVQALEGISRSLARAGGDPRLSQAIRARGKQCVDDSSRALLLFAAGTIEERAGRAAEAEGLYSESLQTIADFLPALFGARRLREAAGDWAQVAKLTARAGVVSVHADNIGDLMMEAGDLYADRLGDAREALANFRAVLGNQPGHVRAFARARQILEAAGEWPVLAQVMAQHIDASTDDASRARLLAARAAVLSERVGDVRGAVVDLERALSISPDQPALLGMLARLYEREQNWQGAAQLYNRLRRSAGDFPMRREAALAEARIFTERVRDFDKARVILEEVVRADATDRAAAMKLAEVASLSGDHARAAALLAEMGRSGSVLERARALLALSEVRHAGLGDVPGSHAAAGEAFLLASSDPTVLPALEEHYTRLGDWVAFAALGDEAAARVPPSSVAALPLRMSVARVHREKLHANDAADAHLRAVVEAFPQNTEARVALAYGRLGTNDAAAVAELRRVIEIDPTVAAAYRGILTVCQRMNMAGASALMASACALLGDNGGAVEAVLSLSMAPPPVPGSLLAEEALPLLVAPTRARFLRRIVALLDPFLHEIYPQSQESLAAIPRLPDNYPSVVRARAVAAALGVTSLGVYRGAGRAMLVMSDPRALVLGPEHLTESGLPRVLFDAAYACARIASGSTMGQVLPPDQVHALLDVATYPSVDGPGYKELRKRLGSVLPRKVRKEIERVIEEDSGDVRREWVAWDEEERRLALRAGVVFSRDVRLVAQTFVPEAFTAPTLDDRRRVLTAHPAVVDALRFAATEACWAAHRKVYGQT